PAPISTISPLTPPPFDRVVGTCLAKEPDDRWQTAHDIAVQLKWIEEGGSAVLPPAIAPAPRRRAARLAPWILALLATSGFAALLVKDRLRPSAPGQVVRFSILPPEKSIFTPPGEHAASQFALSPDGASIAFVASPPEGRPLLWVRRLDSLSAVSFPGTEDASHPFWSPDSRSIGFFTPTSLRRVEASGGVPQKLCDSAAGRGGAWSRSGIIVFADSAATPLFQIPDTGGEPEPVTKLVAARGETSHRYPSFLPDGRRFLYWMRGSKREHQGIYLASLDSQEGRLILKSEAHGIYAPPGYLVTVRQGMLVAYPFDEKNLHLGERPLRVAESIPTGAPPGYAPIAVSPTGLLAYSSAFPRGRELLWVDRSGRRLGNVSESGDFSTPDLSPDEKRVAVSMRDGTKTDSDIWLIDLARGASSRFTFDPGNDRAPLWSPDGSRILFASAALGKLDLYDKPAGGAGEPRLLVTSDEDKFPSDWSADGSRIAFHTFGKGKGNAWDLWVAPLSGGEPRPFIATQFTEVQGRFSPDGRWIAYASDESGRIEVYVTDYPGKRGRWQVSTDGGMQPSWRADGKELFYISPDQAIMSVAVRIGETFETTPAVPLFKVNFPPRVPAYWRYYAPSRDGQRFLVIALVAEAGASPINVVLNWTAALKK
ncbi:MAG TPA: hypothetical protein VFW15_10115, partial [Thermoanaerobaculia bacterium]|nr:hypothetical protein [Thermoanaerobaculia bacterium]